MLIGPCALTMVGAATAAAPVNAAPVRNLRRVVGLVVRFGVMVMGAPSLEVSSQHSWGCLIWPFLRGDIVQYKERIASPSLSFTALATGALRLSAPAALS